MRFAALAALIAILSPFALGQDKPAKDDILQFKDGSIRVGKIVKMDDTGLEIVLTKETRPTRFEYKDIKPASIYDAKLARIDKESGADHFQLGEFCQVNGLYVLAIREYEDALAKDKSLADKAKKKADECRNEDARTKYEEAKRLVADKKYEDANALLKIILDRYMDTPYLDEAKKLMTQITDAIAKDVEAKKQQLEDAQKKKDEQKALKGEERDKALFAGSVEALEDARKSFDEGLDWEGKGNLTKADRAWKASEAKLLAAKKNDELLLKSNDVETIKKTKDLDKQIDVTLVRTYYRLGRMWGTELNYPLAIDFLNKAQKVPHDDQMEHLISEMLLTITQLEMRRRATKGGY